MSDTPFTQRVYELARLIPKGKVATYGQLAALAGHPGAARAVGNLMHRNPYYPEVACHRVVGSNGQLVGYSAGDGLPTKKRKLLAEGVAFRGERVNLALSQWQPNET